MTIPASLPQITEPIAKGSDAEAYMLAVRRDPVGWARQTLGVQLWAKQRQAMELLRDNDRVAIKSGHAVGKSFLSAAMALWYSECNCPSYVICTSSSWATVEKTTWPEMRKMKRYAPYPLGGNMMLSEWRRGIQWGIFSVSPDSPENFAGFRTPHGVLVIVDEASHLEQDIMEAILGLTISANSKIVMLGNPLRPSGPFYDAFSSAGWATDTISSYDVPNVIEDREVIPGLATKSRIDELAVEWGAESSTFKARVLGEFPDATDDMLIPLSWIEAAFAREIPVEIDQRTKCMGVDVARGGGDRVVFIIRDKWGVRYVEIHQHQSLMATAGQIVRLAADHGVKPERTLIDDCGLGGGVTDRLHELDFAVTPVNFGSKADEPDRFANVRAECHWRMREWLDPKRSGRPGAIPKAQKALGLECTIPRIGYTSRGQIKIESKDDIKKRLGRSPDLSDALALTFGARNDVSVWRPGAITDAELHPKRGHEVNDDLINRYRMADDEDAWD